MVDRIRELRELRSRMTLDGQDSVEDLFALDDLARVGASILPDKNGEFDDNLKGALVYAAELLINGGATIQEATEAFVSALKVEP